MSEPAWQHDKQDRKGAYGVSQDTNLLQLPSRARHKMTFTYVAFSRNSVCAAANQGEEMWAYLYYFC